MAILREYSHILHQNKVTSVLAIRARRVPRRARIKTVDSEW